MMSTYARKNVEAWNKLIVKQKFCASSWLITEINILRRMVSKTSKHVIQIYWFLFIAVPCCHVVIFYKFIYPFSDIDLPCLTSWTVSTALTFPGEILFSQFFLCCYDETMLTCDFLHQDKLNLILYIFL